MKSPSEKQLREAERELRRKPKGAQKKLGGGVYMRLDSQGWRRFTYRGAGGLPGGTRESWEEAAKEREALESRAEVIGGDPDELSAIALRKWTLTQYAVKAYWPAALDVLDGTTQNDYRRVLFNDLLKVAGHYTLEELELKPLLIDKIKNQIKKHKQFADDDQHRPGELPLAACDKVLKMGSAVCEHARERGILVRNPFKGIPRFQRVRSRGRGRGSSIKRVKPREVMHPTMVARVGAGIRGLGAQLLERRLVPVLISIGMRPQDICGMRWGWVRTAEGFKRHIEGGQAVKDLAGHLVEGEPKTGIRDIYLFDWVAYLLGLLYEAQGRPPLDGLIIPNQKGKFLDWGNWRDDVWYPSLHRAGIATSRATSALGAFDPYLVRHIGATTMLHAARHDGLPGGYSSEEVARQFGHSAETLHRVYADVPNDLHGVAGLTMDEILSTVWRGVWGPMPGEEGYEERLLTTREASELIASFAGDGTPYRPVAVNALGGRIARGHLPAVSRGARYYVSDWDLAWQGLIPPAGLRG